MGLCSSKEATVNSAVNSSNIEKNNKNNYNNKNKNNNNINNNKNNNKNKNNSSSNSSNSSNNIKKNSTTATAKNNTTISGGDGGSRSMANKSNSANSNAVGNETYGNETELNKTDARKTDSSTESTENDTTLNSLTKSSGSSPAKLPVKMLLLGAGESGKSTILKQMKILHQGGYSAEELENYRVYIYDNLLDVFNDLVRARDRFGVTLSSEESAEFDIQSKDLEIIESGDNFVFEPRFFITLSKLWDLPSTQFLINGPNRSKFYLMDNAEYFVENLQRLSQKNYIPTETDVLNCRLKTSGLHDTLVQMDKNLTLHIFDVGGQRSERKKWIHCFNNVSIILFCVSLNEYDQFLMEDSSQNRLLESLALFDSVMNSRWFSRSSVVLFLNKVDLFAEKIKKIPLKDYFPDYTGGNDLNKAAKYILWRFVQMNKSNLDLYPHVTQATDTTNVDLVFATIKETIMEKELKESGVIR